MELNKNILKYLIDNGIKITEIARKTGISRQNLDRILASSDIKMSQYYKICEALNLDPGYFIDSTTDDRSELQNLVLDVLTLDIHLKALKGEGLVFLGYNEVDNRFFSKYKKLEKPLDIAELEKFEKGFEKSRKKSLSDK